MASPRQPGGKGRRKRQPESFGRNQPVAEHTPPQAQEDPPKNRSYLLPLAFLIPGLLFLGLTVLLFSQSQRLLRHGLEAQGTVIGYASGQNRDGNTIWYPIVRYTAQDGSTHEFHSSSGSGARPYGTGEHVELLYWANDPDHATIRAFFPLWGAVLIIGVLGTVFTTVGGLLFYLIVVLPYRRKHRQHWQRSTGLS